MALTVKHLPYDIKSRASIVAYAKQLEKQSLLQACPSLRSKLNAKNKGAFGTTLEAHYFFYKPNSDSQPDFPEAKLELKCTPLKALKNKTLVSKERLVLNVINYLSIVNETFNSSSFYSKNATLLLIFYLYDQKLGTLEYIIQLVALWSFPEDDLAIIRRDWESILNKIKAGKAHELSEGDTLYLGACTKGADSTSVRSQPYSTIKAKQRAFSLKSKYVNHILGSITNQTLGVSAKIITKPAILKKQSLEQFVLDKFSPHYGKNATALTSEFSLSINPAAKNFYASLTRAILGIELSKQVEEFEKANIAVKTVRIEESGNIKEHLSFPYFDYQTLVLETWDDSVFKETLEQKYFFIFFRKHGRHLRLENAMFWNMPHDDIAVAKKVWIMTRKVVNAGNVVKALQGTRRLTNFPASSDNPIAHVRPHAKNAADAVALPVADRLTGATHYTKHSFWLNSNYVRDHIFS
jgi:DNA mismatch repair protein MutH